MQNSLILYESKYGTAKKTAEMLGVLLGNTCVCAIETPPEKIERYQTLLCVFAFYGPDTAKKTKAYLKTVRKNLSDMKLGIVGGGLAENDFQTHIDAINEIAGKKADAACFIGGELRLSVLSEHDLQALKRFQKVSGMEVKDRGSFDVRTVIAAADHMRPIFKVNPAPMEPEKLRTAIEHFIKRHNTLALATSAGDTPRCTPLEYIYANDNFYIMTEGGHKFAGVLQNGKASIGIYDQYQSMEAVHGLQITADASLVPLFSEEYRSVFAQRGIKQEDIQKLPIHLYLLKLTPALFEFLNADFKKDGYDSKQEYRVSTAETREHNKG